MKIALLSIGLALTASVPVSATTIAGQMGVPCRDKIQFICDAVAIKDPVQREIELSHAIEAGFASGDKQTRKNTYYFVADHWREIDPRRFQVGIAAYDREYEWSDGQMLLEEADLFFSTRDVRRRIYLRAISEGQAPLGKTRTLKREEALGLAAQEGFGDLRPLIEEWYPKLPADVQTTSLPWERVDALLELYDGAENREDGNRRAVGRLAAMDPLVVSEKLEQSDGFRRVFREIAEMACREETSKECKEIGTVLRKQYEISEADFSQRVSAKNRASQARVEPVPALQRTKWMQQILRDIPWRENGDGGAQR